MFAMRPNNNIAAVTSATCDNSIIGDESVPKIVINDENLFFLNCNQHFGNLKNHNSFRVPFDKIASVYFIEKYIYIDKSLNNDYLLLYCKLNFT